MSACPPSSSLSSRARWRAASTGTASEVVRESLRLLRREKAAQAEKLLVLQREVAIGLREADEGRLAPGGVADILAALEADDAAA